MAELFELIGFCLVSFVFIVWSNKRLKSGKDFRPPLIAGILLYAFTIIGARAEGDTIIGNIISIVLLVIAFVVFSGKVKK